jgi:1-deoxy-D-xylulose-5-phosphate reductoisomerase
MVEFCDQSVMAQMGSPDMRLPIQYALTWPERYPLNEEPLDLAKIGTLHFSEPDFERFPLLALAYEAGRKGGNASAVMNAANEVANQAFRDGKIPFLMIEDIVISAVHTIPFCEVKSVEDLIEADRQGREYAEKRVKEVNE